MPTLDADTDEYEIVDEPGAPMPRDLVSYWDAKRAGRLAPPRASIDPLDIPMHLPHRFMLDVVGSGGDFRFRLIGTEIVRGLGRDSTGRYFSELFQNQPANLDRLLARLHSSCERNGLASAGAVSSGTATKRTIPSRQCRSRSPMTGQT
jgi:hypothetical protein